MINNNADVNLLSFSTIFEHYIEIESQTSTYHNNIQTHCDLHRDGVITFGGDFNCTHNP